jgi:hypothetical protein
MANWVRDTPWRQGHVLSNEAVEALRLSASEASECLALVISHDCDLAASPEPEPLVEIIVGRRIAAEDGNHTYAKNARRLHVTFQQGEKTVVGELLATSKATVSKSELAAFEPRSDLSLTAQAKSILQRWLAARYRRSAFADEFVKRLDDAGLGDRLARIVKPSGSHIRGIFF